MPKQQFDKVIETWEPILNAYNNRYRAFKHKGGTQWGAIKEPLHSASAMAVNNKEVSATGMQCGAAMSQKEILKIKTRLSDFAEEIRTAAKAYHDAHVKGKNLIFDVKGEKERVAFASDLMTDMPKCKKAFGNATIDHIPVRP